MNYFSGHSTPTAQRQVPTHYYIIKLHWNTKICMRRDMHALSLLWDGCPKRYYNSTTCNKKYIVFKMIWKYTLSNYDLKGSNTSTQIILSRPVTQTQLLHVQSSLFVSCLCLPHFLYVCLINMYLFLCSPNMSHNFVFFCFKAYQLYYIMNYRNYYY